MTRVQELMITYVIRFLRRAMLSPSYFIVLFRLSCIKFTIWASTHINNVCFVHIGVFQHKERSNFSCYSKISKFYFIVSKTSSLSIIQEISNLLVVYFVFLLFTYWSMMDNFILLTPIEHIANIYYELRKLTSRIQKPSSSIGLLNQSFILILYRHFWK